MQRRALGGAAAALAFAAMFALLAAAGGLSRAPAVRYVALGDSLTVRGAEAPDGWVRIYAGYIEQDLSVRAIVENDAASGLTSEDLRATLPSYLDGIARAHVVTFQIGINDFAKVRNAYLDGLCGGQDNQQCLRDMVQRFRTNWDAITEGVAAVADPATVVVQTMDIYYPMSLADRRSGDFELLGAYLAQMNDHLRRSAAARGIGVARVSAAFHNDDNLDDPAARGLILSDILHPSVAGHRFIADAFRALRYIGSDRDGDGVTDSVDNCPDAANPAQENRDREPIRLPKPVPVYDDATNPAADAIGDACDRRGSSALCGDAGDADGDLLPDQCEDEFGATATNPDSDGDGVLDGAEARYWASDPASADSDGDDCGDGLEVASINGDRRVNAADLQQLSVRFGPVASGLWSFDSNGDGTIGATDLAFVAMHFGACPSP